METHYRHYDTWSIRYEPLDTTVTMTFLTNADGEISAVELPLDPAMAPVRLETARKEMTG